VHWFASTSNMLDDNCVNRLACVGKLAEVNPFQKRSNQVPISIAHTLVLNTFCLLDSLPVARADSVF